MSVWATVRRWLLPAALALSACSPALNWRQAPLGGLSFSLPCKPDKAQRTVTLADRDVPLEMQGCEAQGALFAISRARVGEATAVPEVIQAWRASALAAMRADAAAATVLAAPSHAGVPGLASAAWLSAVGQRPQGGKVQAQLAWLVLGGDVYHLAVYADTLGADMTESFFTDITLP
ncbi:MAG: hypothetical protein K2X79_03950 [Burkholderiaceae bacterium]|nr:hypothetical protein [Burkholderiaceae bacterium]